MRIPLLALPLLLAATSMASMAVDADSPYLRYGGRTFKNAPKSVQWSWSGTGVTTAFIGTGCQVRLRATGAFFRILVDGVETGTLDLTAKTDTVYPLVTGLANGRHEVELRQKTEASTATTTFHGFIIEGTPTMPSEPRSRRLEFYGNSITCGYGILDSVNSHPFANATEDEGKSFAAVASELVGAEHHSVSWSGRGVLRNYGGDTLSPTVPKMYDWVLSNSTHRWDFSWIPDAVVIDLGTNDFSVAPAPDSARFEAAYLGLLRNLHAKYPVTKFVLVDGPMVGDSYPLLPDGTPVHCLSILKRHLDNLVAAASALGISATHLSLTPNDPVRGYGADWHPNQAQGRLNGQELAKHLESRLGWTPPTAILSQTTVPGVQLIRSGGAWAVQIPRGTQAKGTIVDASGTQGAVLNLSGSSPTVIPNAHQARWLRVDLDPGRQILVLPRLSD